MAEATRRFDAKKNLDKITVVMNCDEAHALCILLANIGGSPSHSLRKHIDTIRVAIEDVGIIRPDDTDKYFEDYQRTYFKDYTEDVLAKHIEDTNK